MKQSINKERSKERCSLSPMFFNLYTEQEMKKVSEEYGKEMRGRNKETKVS